MLTDAQQAYLKTIARTQQIIIASLAAGVLMFLAVVLVLDLGEPQDQAGEPFMTYLGIGGAVLAIVAWGVVPGIITSRMREAIVAGRVENLTLRPFAAADLGDIGPLGGISQARMIVGAAILEGAAFFNLVVYLMEQQIISVAAAGLLAVIIMASIPTLGRLESWIEGELRSIEQLRQMRTSDAR